MNARLDENEPELGAITIVSRITLRGSLKAIFRMLTLYPFGYAQDASSQIQPGCRVNRCAKTEQQSLWSSDLSNKHIEILRHLRCESA